MADRPNYRARPRLYYDHLVNWMQDYERLNAVLANLGIRLTREEFDHSLSQPKGIEFLIQRTLSRAFLSFADYYTPFFVMSRKSNMAFWLMHLSMHARARDVMTGLHWELQNHFAHFGGAGQHMLGYDPSNPPPASQDFLFDDDARHRTIWAMQNDLPSLIGDYREGVEFRRFFAAIANGSPADSEITRQALIKLAELGVVEIQTSEGNQKRAISSLKATDRLILPAQPRFFFTGKPLPVFARQPKRFAKLAG